MRGSKWITLEGFLFYLLCYGSNGLRVTTVFCIGFAYNTTTTTQYKLKGRKAKKRQGVFGMKVLGDLVKQVLR